MKDAYTTKELAEIEGVNGVTILRFAKRESWKSRPRPGRGGGAEWIVASMPEHRRAAIAAYEAKAAEATLVSYHGDAPALLEPNTLLLSGKRREKALAKADLLSLYLKWVGKAKIKAVARKEFITAYKGGAWPKLLETLGECVSWQSLERWKLKIRDGSAFSLADNRGLHNQGKTEITEEQYEILIRAALHPNKPHVAEVVRTAKKVFKAQGITCDLADKTLRRAVLKFRETNYGEWVYTREGKKAWNDKCAFYIERDYDRIEVGDIVVADGHKLNFETVNPWTGQASRMEMVLWYDMKSNFPLGWEILPTEDIRCIASAFGRSVLRLGKKPKVAYLDNGRAFKSAYFNGVDFTQSGLGGLFHELGIHTIFAWPYHGQSKPVERFFKTFGELERYVPSYVGTDIGSKPPRMKRNETLHRKIYEASARALTLDETHYAVALWFDEYVQRPQKGHLNGAAPLEVFKAGCGPGVNPVELYHLMLAKKVRTINRNGISFLGSNYYHPQLYGRKHGVIIRYDLQDRRSVLVYGQDGKFICEAVKTPKIHPAARLLGTDADRKALQGALSLKRDQERIAGATARRVLEEVVLPEHQARMKSIAAAQPEKSEPAQTAKAEINVKSIEEAKDRARKENENRPAYIPPAQRSDIITELDRYEYLFQISVRDGIPLRPQDLEWMASYEQTDEFHECAAPRFQQLRGMYARIAEGGGV